MSASGTPARGPTAPQHIRRRLRIRPPPCASPQRNAFMQPHPPRHPPPAQLIILLSSCPSTTSLPYPTCYHLLQPSSTPPITSLRCWQGLRCVGQPRASAAGLPSAPGSATISFSSCTEGHAARGGRGMRGRPGIGMQRTLPEHHRGTAIATNAFRCRLIPVVSPPDLSTRWLSRYSSAATLAGKMSR